MAITNIHAKTLGQWKGLNLRDSALYINNHYATDMENAQYNKAGALTKRFGYQVKADGAGGAGTAVYADVNLTTNVSTQKLVSFDSNMHILNEGTVTITYSGSSIVTSSVYFSTVSNTYRLSLVENLIEVLDFNLGVGREEGAIISIATLVIAINAITHFSAVATGTTSVSSAYLDLFKDITITSTLVMRYSYWNTVNSTVTNPLSVTQTHKNDTDFINASSVNNKNVLYVSTGYDSLMKYDGQTFYKAGMPAGTITSATDVFTSGNITNTSTKYIALYRQIDNKGNVIEGIASATTSPINASATKIDVVLNNIQAGSGFNTNCGIVNGAQSTVTTILIDSGHTLKVGDTAYFYDAVSTDYVTRTVTAKDSTHITISGAAVTVADDAVISNNLRIVLYRNQSAGITFDIVVELPNNSFSATQPYRDNISDNDLGAEYVIPVKLHGLPPSGRYITSFRNQLFIADNLSTVYWSDIDGPEYFPPGDNSENIYTEKGDSITGLGALTNSVFFFKNQSIHIMTGDIGNDQFRVDPVNQGNIGCESHHSIKEVNGELFFLSKKGVFSIGESSVLTERSQLIEPRFTKAGQVFEFTKAVAINWLAYDKYVLLMPVTSNENSSNRYLDLDLSNVFVYDYKLTSWLSWSSLNMVGGISLYNNNLWFVSRRFSTLISGTTYELQKVNITGTASDYIDHDSAIDFSYKTNWECMDDPSLLKKFTRIKFFALETDSHLIEPPAFNFDVSIEFNYLDTPVGMINVDFAPDALGWGDDAYGDDPWGSSNEIQIVRHLPYAKSKSMRLTFSNNTILEPILLSGYELEVAMNYREFIKE